MTLKERLLLFWNENQKVAISLLTALILAMGGGAYVAGTQNPPPEVVVSEFRSLSGVEPIAPSLNCWPGDINIVVEDDGSTTTTCIVPVFSTPTPVSTETPLPPTFTPTSIPATSTPFPPTALPPTPTFTAIPPTATVIKTSTPTKTSTPCAGGRCPTATATLPLVPTATPGNVATPTPKPTLPVLTVTPVPTSPGLTITPTPGVSPTPDPGQVIIADDGCEVTNAYHPVMEGVLCKQYHTGANMRDPEIQKLFDDYAYPGLVNEILDTYGDVFQPLFASSASEIPHHYRGFKWIVDYNENCDQYESQNVSFDDWACIIYSANRIHDDGTLEHLFTRLHSAFFIRVVCGKGNDKVWQKSTDLTPANCGLEYGPQLMDFGEHHKKYKDEWNPIPGTDSSCFSFPSSPPDLLDGGLYRISQPEERAGKPPIMGWWGQPPNAVEKDCYSVNANGDTPNAGNSITWSSTAWQIYDGATANMPIEIQKQMSLNVPPSPLGGNHTFTIINMRVLFQVPGIGSYWTDQWGNLKVGCAAISSTCFPIVFVGNYPMLNGLTQQAIVQRRSSPSSLLDCILSPCLQYAEPGTEVFPYYDNPTGAAAEHAP